MHTTTTELLKVAWVRNPVHEGEHVKGKLNCPCGRAPETYYEPQEPIRCNCGRKYTWDGWLVWPINATVV